MTDRRCGTCRHWRESFPYAGSDTEPDALGDCLALDTVALPFAWRWAPREVVCTERQEGADCPAWRGRALEGVQP